jgi:hypothetical protein
VNHVAEKGAPTVDCHATDAVVGLVVTCVVPIGEAEFPTYSARVITAPDFEYTAVWHVDVVHSGHDTHKNDVAALEHWLGCAARIFEHDPTAFDPVGGEMDTQLARDTSPPSCCSNEEMSRVPAMRSVTPPFLNVLRPMSNATPNDSPTIERIAMLTRTSMSVMPDWRERRVRVRVMSIPTCRSFA